MSILNKKNYTYYAVIKNNLQNENPVFMEQLIHFPEANQED